MFSRTMLFIYNPLAGKREIVDYLHPIINYFTEQGFLVTTHATQQDNDAFLLTKSIGASFDYVVCSGGDGTLNEVVRGLMSLSETEKRPKLGYLPSGSTNDFGNSLGLPSAPLAAARVICEGVPYWMDVGQLGEGYFTYVAAFGLFTDVSYDTSQSMKNMFGHTAYILEGMKRLTKIKTFPCRVLCGEEVFEDHFVFGMVTNSASIGGFRLPGDVMKEEPARFHMILLKEANRFSDYQQIIGSLLGMREPSEQFIIRPVEEVEIISPDGLAWTLDGEYGGIYTHSQIVVNSNCVELMIPKNKKETVEEV